MSREGSRSRLGELFAELADLDEERCAKRLREIAAESRELARELESLLAADREAGRFADRPEVTTGFGSPWATRVESEWIGRQVGPYRISAELARGGMGVVYRAERTDGAFERAVAVKVLRPELSGSIWSSRFEAERRILASLDHPGIAGLLDAGATADGAFYLVLELIEGERLDSWSVGRALAERLQVFLEICRAVEHAHRRLVLHRDLKPANVLVGADGRPRLLDFGIARLLEVDAESTQLTRISGLPLTPAYASPEQIRGEVLTTSADVYSLGVILFELLTGRRPVEVGATESGEALAHRIEIGSRPIASDVLRRADRSEGSAGHPPITARQLEGDLDAITATALAPRPGDRYPSVEALAADLERHLTGVPIAARSPGLWERARSLARRHRARLAAGAIVAVTMVAATAVSLSQAMIARGERDLAARRFDEVRELASALIFSIHDEITALAGSTTARRTVLAEGLRLLEILARDAGGDTQLTLELAHGYQRIGDVLGGQSDANLGDWEGALGAYERAVGLLGPLVARAGGGDPAHEEAWIGAQLKIVSARAASQERRAEALATALAAARRLHAQAPEEVEARELLGRVLFWQASRVGFPDSLELWLEADGHFAAALEATPDEPNRLRNAALTQRYLGGYYQAAADYEAALLCHQRAFELGQRRLRLTPEDRRTQLDVAIDLGNLAHAHGVRGEHEAAIAGYLESLAIRRRLSDAEPADHHSRARYAYAHSVLGRAYLLAGHLAPAREHAEQAAQLYDSLGGSVNEIDQVELYQLFATLEAAEGQPVKACHSVDRALESLEGLPSSSRMSPSMRAFEESLVDLRGVVCPKNSSSASSALTPRP